MNQLQWRKIWTIGGILGVLAGVIPMLFGETWLFSTLPIAMMFSTYYSVPRMKEKRFPNALTLSLLTAVIAFVLYFIYAYATMGANTATTHLKQALTSLAMSVLFIGIFGSWFFTKVQAWTEKKKVELDARMDAKKKEESKPRDPKLDKPYVAHATTKRYRNTKKKKK